MELKRTLSTWLTYAYGLGTVLARISRQRSSRFGQTVFPNVEETEEERVKLTFPRMALKADGSTDGQNGRTAGEKCGLASLVAAFTAFSYAKLCSLYPKAAGEAIYVRHAFDKKWLTSIVGWMVVVTGVVSAAAMTRGFAGYFPSVSQPTRLAYHCLGNPRFEFVSHVGYLPISHHRHGNHLD